MIMFRQIIPILIVFSLTLCWGQKISKDYKKELKAQNSAIQSLRNEIEATKNRIQSEGRKEKTSARRVNNLSEEISLLQRLVREIKKEEELLVADISRTEKHIKKSEIELDTLQLGSIQLATMLFILNTL